MDVLGKLGAALMGIGGILVGIFGIMVWADASLAAWYQGLSYLVLGVGLLLWGIPALFSPGASRATMSAGSAQPRQRQGA